AARLFLEPEHARVARVVGELAPFDPAKIARLLASNRVLPGRRDQEIADVEVQVRRLAGPRRNLVDVDVERQRRDGILGEWREVEQVRFLARLAQRDRKRVRLPVRMPTELQPAVELRVMGEE